MKQTPAQKVKLELGIDLATDFENRKAAVYAYVDHVFNGGDPTETPDGASWYNNLASPIAMFVVNEYRKTQGVSPNPFHPGNKHVFRAFDRLLNWPDDGGWMKSTDLRPRIANRHVEATFTNRELVRFGYTLHKEFRLGKACWKLTHEPIEEAQVG